MSRLRAAMTSRYKERDEDVKFHTPRNLETLNLSFRGERVAKVLSSHQDHHRLLTAQLVSLRQLAPSRINLPKTGDILSGLLVAKDYSYTLLAPSDLRDFAGLTTCAVTQRQKIVLGVGWNLVKWHLEGMYGSVEEGLDKDAVPTMRVSFKSKLLASQPSD
jgi:cleavage and polyadenylation specificity factor subunit 3